MLYDSYIMSMGPHDFSLLKQCALARKNVRGGLGGFAPWAVDVMGPSAPQRSRKVWGAANPSYINAIIHIFFIQQRVQI